MKDFVKKFYGSIAEAKTRSCCEPNVSCCSSTSNVSEKVGYIREELDAIPQEADMGLGCGNPVELASLKEGETVVDFGSGGGIDVFLAARRVGESGKVVGIDMTEAMVEKARENAKRAGFKNVEFKLGDIDNVPLAEGIADCIISNCVINLAEDKQKVFNEAFRILKPGGRLMVSDMVLLEDLPESILKSAEMYAGCIAGALREEDYLDKIRKAGFQDVSIVGKESVRLSDYVGSDSIINDVAEDVSDEEMCNLDGVVVSVKISAKKP